MAALVEEIVSRTDRRSRRETPLPAPQAPSESATGRKPPPSPLVPLPGAGYRIIDAQATEGLDAEVEHAPAPCSISIGLGDVDWGT
jgi:hypothetical protein